MRILFLSTDFKPRPGGIAELSHQIAAALARHGHALTVVTDKRTEPGWDDGAQPYAIRRCLDVRRFPRLRTFRGMLEAPLWNSRAARQIRQTLAGAGIDAVLAGNYHRLWLRALASYAGPFFCVLHGEDVASAAATRVPGRKAQMRRTLLRATHVFANSRHTAGQACTLLPNACLPVSVIGCGVPLDSIRPIPPARPDSDATGPVLLSVARLVRRKGIDTTLRAVNLLADRYPGLRYVVVGDGPDRAELEALARALALNDRVEFTGYVDDTRKHELYAASDLFVMPSRPGAAGECEGFGISLLEANAHGLAVVGSRVGGIPDAVANGENGILVEPNDIAALAAALAQLLDDPAARRRMAVAGQTRIREKYNWEMIARTVEARMLETSGVTDRRDSC